MVGVFGKQEFFCFDEFSFFETWFLLAFIVIGCEKGGIFRKK